MQHLTAKNTYSNWTMLSPAGEPMCKCSFQRAKWYLKRGLAIEEASIPRTVRLTFEPKGTGWAGDEFYLSPKENECVSCGATGRLTKHHVVPLMYRRHFPAAWKESASHDVLLLCDKCHEEYERHADTRKVELHDRFGVPLLAPVSVDALNKTRGLARRLVHDGGHIPAKRQNEMLGLIAAVLGFVPDAAELEALAKEPSSRARPEFDPGAEIVARLGGEAELTEFVREWRRHFVHNLNPRRMPKGWSAERGLRR